MPDKNSKIILKGATGSGKSDLLLNRYKYMVEELKIPSENILLLLLNRTQSLKWRTKTILSESSTIWRTSYYGFIQSEIRTYYPIISKSCDEIINKNIKPIFLTFESAQFLVSKVIDRRRRKDGMFQQMTTYTDRIAIDLVSNLVRAAISDVPYFDIGNRLYSALELKDEERKKIFKDGDDILFDYRKKCMELGIFDFGMAIDLFNNYLLKSSEYIEKFKKRIKHIIVDNIEECVPTGVDFIGFLIPNLDTCLLGYNDEGGYGESFGSNHSYVKKKLIDKLEHFSLDKNFTCSDKMYDFSESLYRKIVSEEDEIQDSKVYNDEGIIIERNIPVELRSEMLENVANRVLKLVNEEGYKKSDIVILSTHADAVTEYVIGRILEGYGIELKNIARKDRLLDNSFSRSLITLAKLCHPTYGIIPKRDEVKDLIVSILKIDPIRSSILAGEICSLRPFAGFPEIDSVKLSERIGYYNIDKYHYIKDWINDYKDALRPLSMNEFFRKVFLEILISDEILEDDILQAKNLIDSAQSFVDIISRFKRDANKDFLDMVVKGVKSAESIFELEEKISGNNIIIATPVPFLASSLANKVVILVGISSNNWSPRNIKELTNIQVLTKTWDEELIYTEELEEKKQKNYLAKIMRNVIKRCGEKLITFESLMSASGCENDGILSEYFDDIN